MPSRQNAVRIIAGSWRGKRIRIPAGTMVRPTPDRVRETLFNWLSATIPGARCLDLFAGTGVLGLEALSRGAGETLFVERDPSLAKSLRQQIEALDANAAVVCDDVARMLDRPPAERFDVVFLDPPYDLRLEPILEKLSEWLAPGAQVYVERPLAKHGDEELDDVAAALPGASVLKESSAGRVRYGVLGLPK